MDENASPWSSVVGYMTFLSMVFSENVVKNSWTKGCP